MTKTWNNKAWFFVLPVLVLVAFNAIIPLMTVVNYSVQESFGGNVFFFEGVRWFQQVLLSDRFHASLGRQPPGLGRSGGQARGSGRGGRNLPALDVR